LIPSKYSSEERLKKKYSITDNTEQLQKKEKVVTHMIIVISIIIGILMTLVFTGLLEFIY